MSGSHLSMDKLDDMHVTVQAYVCLYGDYYKIAYV